MNSSEVTKQGVTLNRDKIPFHVAIIMDGSGRWAKKRLLNRVKGHEKGGDTVRSIVRTAREVGIGALTLYAFSTENWQRPQSEIAAIMSLFKKFLKSEEKDLLDNNIRLSSIGQIDRLPQDVRNSLKNLIAATRDNDGMILNLALSYGGRSELLEMVRKIADKARNGEIDPAYISEDTISGHLYTAGLPDPDLMIRTSGEMRISNFLLWQIAYSEIFVTETLWPDFTAEEFLVILKQFQQRERRFGKVLS